MVLFLDQLSLIFKIAFCLKGSPMKLPGLSIAQNGLLHFSGGMELEKHKQEVMCQQTLN
jgi:hypothetical protein